MEIEIKLDISCVEDDLESVLAEKGLTATEKEMRGLLQGVKARLSGEYCVNLLADHYYGAINDVVEAFGAK